MPLTQTVGTVIDFRGLGIFVTLWDVLDVLTAVKKAKPGPNYLAIIDAEQKRSLALEQFRVFGVELQIVG